MKRGLRTVTKESTQKRTYFNKVLIANRGEIACRVIKTCKRLNIKTVAIYSTADEQAKHVKLADEAYCVGPPPTSQSYLQQETILKICKEHGVDAVHPGYGFLSENKNFSELLAANGVTFIGPSGHSMTAMSDKISSKATAKKAGVNIIPGFQGEIDTVELLLEKAKEIGYPVMIKATSGGGGKGMRVAHNETEAKHFYKLCRQEAKSSFGDDRVLVEKFVEEPRHIEIQIIADKHGNVLYLPERECSIQRRNQKVIEEAPSTFLTPAIREAMGKQAAALAREVNYYTAGTVEMMVDKDRNFYFLEMNTRLQVEHPITEMITGLDLVEEMLRAAAGKELSVKQSDIKINGWATECRVYAEDPLRDFLPVIGRITDYVEPTGEGVRVDSGILPGSEISVFYDPLICKLATWAPTRTESLAKMTKSLDNYVIRGLNRNNVNFLRDTIHHPRYLSGNFTTKFIAEEYQNGYKGHELTSQEQKELAIMAALVHSKIIANQEFYRFCIEVGGSFVVVQRDADGVRTSEVLNREEASKQLKNGLTGAATPFASAWKTYEPVINATYGNQELIGQLWNVKGMGYTIQYSGTQYLAKVYSGEEFDLSAHMKQPIKVDHGSALLSPMPGVVVEILVKPGQKVKAGEDVVVLEAMKMRNALQATADGVVDTIQVKLNENIEEDHVLVTFKK